MALRRNGKDDRQLNRKNYRRPSGRTAEFFDLRETDQDSYSDSNSGSFSGSFSGSYSGRSSGRPGDSDSARPYRERHRVEVNTQDYYYGSGENRAGGYSGRTEDMYGGQQSSGRIVHGNAPGNRSSRTQTSDRRDIAPDLLYGSSTGSNAAGNGRSGANSRTGSRNAGTAGRGDSPGMTGRSSYSAYGTDYNYGRSGSTYSSYGRSDRTYSTAGGNRQNTARSGSYSSYSRNDYNRNDNSGRDYNGRDYRRAGTYSDRRYADETYAGEEYPEEIYRDSLPEDGTEYDDLYGERDYSGEETLDSREDLGRRLRQRAQSRKEREMQLRAFYIRIGAGAAVLLLLLIFILPRVIGRLTSGKEGKEQTQTVAEMQGSQGTADQEKEAEASADQKDTADEENAADGEDADAAAQAPDSGQTGTEGGGSGQTESGQEDGQQVGQQEGQEQAINGSGYPEGGEDTGTSQSADGTVAGQTETAQTSPAAGQPVDQPVSPSGAPAETAAASGLYTKQDDWHFILVNPWYLLPEEYAEVTTSSLPNGESVDTRCYSDLVKMLDDCRTAGGEPVVCSSYRPHSKQEDLYRQQVKDLMAKGMKKEEAEAEAGTTVALPGTSEHELGLAVDICDYDYQALDDAQADTATQKWLMKHSWEYGFILRYPKNKSDITGIIYEPWHYRYVGKEAAEEITRKGICLEEFLKL